VGTRGTGQWFRSGGVGQDPDRLIAVGCGPPGMDAGRNGPMDAERSEAPNPKARRHRLLWVDVVHEGGAARSP
jgi:hypothetical protein